MGSFSVSYYWDAAMRLEDAISGLIRLIGALKFA
jgi:hypothetical protein